MVEGKIWIAVTSPISGFSECDVILSGEVYYPEATKPYAFCQAIWQDYDDGLLSFDCGSEYRGLLNIAVRAPVKWTYAQHAGLAGRILDLFTYGGKYTYDDISVQIHSKPKFFGSSYLDNSHNRIDIQVPFRAWA